MRIAACLGVKDEAELIEQTLAHLRAVGVDVILACDMYSSDGTAEILARHAGRGDLVLFQMDDTESQDEWARTNLEMIMRADADWVLFLDADEYPIPASGRLADCVALQDADVVVLDRFNVPLGPAGPALPSQIGPDRYDELLVVAEPIRRYWDHVRENPEAPWICKKLANRVIARPEQIGDLSLGMHDVTGRDGIVPRRAGAPDLFVAHVPFTTRSRFARKVANAREVLRVHDDLFGQHSARHWRRWADLAEDGRLDEEFDRMVFDDEQLARLRGDGIVRSAAEVFAKRALARTA